jgi:hypothetical protein
MDNFNFSKNKFIWNFYNNYLKYNNLHICIYAFGLIWIFEWIYIIQYSLNFWSYTRILFPYRIPMTLIICFIYWLYIWGISVWRRTLFGRFTRGDRKLWFKGFTAFWFIEFSTILGIYIAACWMSWGPLPLMPRYFLMQKKSFLFELTLFTYIVWLIYLMRLGLKWYLWRTQAIITTIIIFIISCLLWRDFITLYTRDVINIDIGAKWRYVKLNSIIYSLSSIWWTYHFIGTNTITHSLFIPLQEVMDNNFLINPFSKFSTLTEYQKYHWLPLISKYNFDSNAFPFSNDIIDLNQLLINKLNLNNSIEFINDSITLDSYKFYPRKIGFYPKKIAMWYFLVVLKIWHHIMLFIWWFFYLLRLNTKKKSSYSLLSICYFNVYCCFLICILVYCFNLLPIWENFFRIKPYIRSRLQNWNIINEGLYYCFDLFTFQNSMKGSKHLLNYSFYNLSPKFVINFHQNFSNNTWLIDEKIIYYFGICR